MKQETLKNFIATLSWGNILFGYQDGVGRIRDSDCEPGIWIKAAHDRVIDGYQQSTFNSVWIRKTN